MKRQARLGTGSLGIDMLSRASVAARKSLSRERAEDAVIPAVAGLVTAGGKEMAPTWSNHGIVRIAGTDMLPRSTPEFHAASLNLDTVAMADSILAADSRTGGTPCCRSSHREGCSIQVGLVNNMRRSECLACRRMVVKVRPP